MLIWNITDDAGAYRTKADKQIVVSAFMDLRADSWLNKFDTNKDASNKCENERIFLNFLEFDGIYLNLIQFYEFPDVLLSSELYFHDIWETHDQQTDGPTDGQSLL